MFLLMAIPAIVYGGLAFTIPESPRYLVASHKIPEARKVLSMLLGEKNLEITISRIQETLEREDKPSWRDLRKPRSGSSASTASCGSASGCRSSSSSSVST